MESHEEPANDVVAARRALATITADRHRLGRRLKAQTWWTAPMQALLVAVAIASPAAGIGWGMAMVCGLASLGLLGLDYVVRRRIRLATVPGPSGPLSLTVIIVLSVLLVASFALAIVFEVTDQRSWLFVTAAAGFIGFLIGSVGYDLANARELNRAR